LPSLSGAGFVSQEAELGGAQSVGRAASPLGVQVKWAPLERDLLELRYRCAIIESNWMGRRANGGGHGLVLRMRAGWELAESWRELGSHPIGKASRKWSRFGLISDKVITSFGCPCVAYKALGRPQDTLVTTS